MNQEIYHGFLTFKDTYNNYDGKCLLHVDINCNDD